ncbi:MAG: hypothetical protein HOC20_04255 [Chloroflexi bacterium]|nr:hypothetical protein [Chloroflexota bacterium]
MNRNNLAIKGNTQGLKHVFLNMTNNAAQAMMEAHAGGTPTIETRKSNGEEMNITFNDDGPGISPEMLDRVFEPLFITKDVGKGAGLGLSICYGITKNHGREISAKSGEGKGTAFTIELPIIPDTTGTNN